MKNSFLSILILFFACASTKNNLDKKTKDIIGIINKRDLVKAPHKNWFKESYDTYDLKDSLRDLMNKNFKNVKVKAFVGTWCNDSKRELPTLLKILNEVNVPEKKIEIIGVNHKKKANGLEKGYSIFRVPTFIFYKNNKELGRFVEFPIESLEQDILKIVSGKKYKHYYED